MSKTYAVPPAPPQNHGKTVAAYVMFLGVVGGSIVAALGLILGSMLILAIGVGIMVVTIIVSIVLRAMGLGQSRTESPVISR